LSPQAPSTDGTLPPSPAPRWDLATQPQSELHRSIPGAQVLALALEGRRDRPGADGGMAPPALAGGRDRPRTVGAGRQGLPARGHAERGSWLALANRGDG
jgi:hypothetical protein